MNSYIYAGIAWMIADVTCSASIELGRGGNSVDKWVIFTIGCAAFGIFIEKFRVEARDDK